MNGISNFDYLKMEGDIKDKSSVCLCGHSNIGRILTIEKGNGEFKVIECKNCGLKRTLNRVTPHVFYRPDKIDNPEESINKCMEWGGSIFSEIYKFKKEGRLLDIGCSIGGFVKLANTRGFKGEGIDLNKYAIEVGKNLGLNLHHGDFKDMDFEKESFDVVTLNHCFAYIDNPNNLIKRIYSILKKGGILGISDSNCSGLLPRIIKGRWYGWHEENVWHFSTKTLISSLRSLDERFKIVKVKNSSMAHHSDNPILNFIKKWVFHTIELIGQGDKTIVLLQK